MGLQWTTTKTIAVLSCILQTRIGIGVVCMANKTSKSRKVINDFGAGFVNHFNRHRSLYIPLFGWIILGIFAAFIEYLRYPFNFTDPNFYGEDGKIYVANVLVDGPVAALFNLFNGYLIIGQYIVTELGMALNAIVGNGFSTLPKAIAVVSYLVFGLACALPWLLFRKRLGSIWTLVLIAFLALVPLGGWAYTTLGTVGNLKFLLFYVAFIFIIYRNTVALQLPGSKRILLVDLILLICILTNVVVVGLLPLALYPYKDKLLSIWKTKSIKPGIQFGLLSLLVLGALSAIYIAVIYKLGIPKMPGYLDEPLNMLGLMNTVYRSSWYGLIYPAQETLNFLFVGILLLLTSSILLIKKYRFISFAVLYSILICALGFALNRTGVTHYFTAYVADGGPGQFFYGGTMIFVFGVAYILADRFNSLKTKSKFICLVLICLYFIWALPFTGFRDKSFNSYKNRPSIIPALTEACARPGDTVKIDIYPTPEWFMEVSRADACPK